MATRTELVSLVLEKLGALSAGETVSAENFSSVGTAYDNIYEELRTNRSVNWGSGDSIPDEAVRPLVIIVANDLTSTYCPGTPLEAKIERQYPHALLRLNAALSENFTSTNVKPDYF